MDGGDSLANEFTVAYCRVILEDECQYSHKNRIKKHTINGFYVRHPDPEMWYSLPGRVSRDQITPVICYLAVNKNTKKEFYSLLWEHAKRGFVLAWNTVRNFQYPTLAEHLAKSTPDVAWNPKPKLPDITGPDIWQIWARGLVLHSSNSIEALCKLILFRPIVWLGDLQLLIGAITNRYKWTFKRYLGTGRAGIDHDDRNFALKLHLAATNMPSVLSLLAMAIYGLERPLACFSTFWEIPPEEPPIHVPMSIIYKQMWGKK